MNDRIMTRDDLRAFEKAVKVAMVKANIVQTLVIVGALALIIHFGNCP